MRPQFLHLTGSLRGRTVTYDGESWIVGRGDAAAIQFDDPPPVPAGGAPQPAERAVCERHAELRFVEEGCSFYLRPLDGQVFVNDVEIEEAILQDDDLLEFGVGGPRVRFRVQVDEGRVCKPVRKMLRDAQDVGKASGIEGFTRTMTRDLLTHATWQLKIGVPLVLLGLVLVAFGLGWFGAGGAAERWADDVGALRQQLDEMRSVSASELAELRLELERRAAALDELRAVDDASLRVHETWSRGVCLLHGVYGFGAPGGAPGEPLRGPDGAPLGVEYTGSGFLVSPRGCVVTNRHVVRPWESDEEAQRLAAQGLTPMLIRLTATFPGRAPIEVDPTTVRLRTDSLDVASLRVSIEGVPVLELSDEEPESLRGTRVILVGYPTGVRALLAKADERVLGEVMDGDPPLTEIIQRLADRDAVTPVITSGVLGDVRAEKLVYDADTTVGGSGGPVFGRDGRVVGVNFAILREFGGSNFGVPIRYVRELIDA